MSARVRAKVRKSQQQQVQTDEVQRAWRQNGPSGGCGHGLGDGDLSKDVTEVELT